MIKDNNTVIFEENGVQKEYSIILTFDTDEKTYYVYTDDELDEDGFVKTYAGIYDDKDGVEKLLPIESDDEWELIETIIEEFEAE